MKKKHIWWIIFCIAGVGITSWELIVRNVEQAKYERIESHGSIEIRDYTAMIVAEVTVQGERQAAIKEGFRMLADYIFGNNSASQKIAMTAPVMQQSTQKIAISAPVIQQKEENVWNVRFMMPAQYTLTTLPKPNHSEVQLKELESKRFATIRFSGMNSQENLKQHTEKLQKFIDERTMTTTSTPIYAFFNPPWTIPFLRRNEVMMEVLK